MYNFPMKKEAPSLETLSERLNYALTLTGTKKADLARSISVKPQVIQFLCASKTQASRFTFEIATALGLSTRWLATGDGEMFVADDPKQQFLKTYSAIPLLSHENIKKVFLYDNSPDQNTIKLWLPLKTKAQDSFAIEIIDTSMEPLFPLGSYVFIRKCLKKNIDEHKFIFAYLVKFDTFIVRELIKNELSQILMPKNKEIFKEITVNKEILFLGVVTDCFWHLRD